MLVVQLMQCTGTQKVSGAHPFTGTENSSSLNLLPFILWLYILGHRQDFGGMVCACVCGGWAKSIKIFSSHNTLKKIY